MREVVLYEIFLDLHKLHGALYRDRYLGILYGYGVGPRMLRILWIDWVHLLMVVKSGVAMAHLSRYNVG